MEKRTGPELGWHVKLYLLTDFDQRTSLTSVTYASCATFLFLPHFDIICDLLLNRRTATWNLFVNPKLCMSTWYIRQHIFTWSTAYVDLGFSTNLPRICNLFLWIRQSLSPLSPPRYIDPHGISVTCNMKSRLVINFPTPYEWWSNALPPRQEEASNARSMPEGGGDVQASIWLVQKFNIYYIYIFDRIV